jgi:hypothetical protein
MSSRRRFATPAQSLQNDCSSHRGLHVRLASVGVVLRSRAGFVSPRAEPSSCDSHLCHRCTGAFVAGVMVSATDYAERTIHQLEPIRNLFAALFLASIGLIMNPIFLWTHMDVLFASVLVVIVTKVGQRG